MLFSWSFFAEDDKSPRDILYNDTPYKIQAKAPESKKQKNVLSIYENLYTGQNPVVIENILSNSENPVSFNNTLDNIDKIINHLIDDIELKNYKGIKIFVFNDLQYNITSSNSPNIANEGYVLDLGLYISHESANENLAIAEKLCPKLTAYTKEIAKNYFNDNVLYNIKVQGIGDFNIALNICDRLNKNKQECIIVNF